MKHLKTIFACLLMAVLSIGQVRATEGQQLYSGDFTSVSNHGYTQNKTFTLSSKNFKSSVSQVASSVFYLGTNTNATNTPKGVLNDNSDFSSVVTALKAENATYNSNYETAHAYALLLSNSFSSVGNIKFSWAGANGAGTAYIFADSGSGWTKLTSASVSNGTSTSGNIEYSNTTAGGMSFNSLVFVFLPSANNKNIRLTSLVIKEGKAAGGNPTCATPTFTPAAGSVLSGQTVTIASATEGGASIYYTMGDDPANPTASSTPYTAPISITGNTTIKAIAIKDGYDNSSVATAAYTIITPYTTIPALATAMTASDQSVYVTFGGWKVSVVKNSQAFVTDGTNGLIIYQSGHGLVEGDVLTGTVQCTLVSYNGVVELKGVTKTMDGITVTGGTISPTVKTIAEANALTALNTGLLIKLENVTYNGTAFVDAGSNTIAPYNTFYSYSLTSGQKYDVTGIVQQFQSKSQIYPRKAADIVAQTSIATPTFSPTAGEYTEAQTVTITCATASTTIYYTTNGDTPDNTSTQYTGAITVDATQTIKAIAYKGEDHSEVATAAYTINIPIPAHTFQVVHKFETGEGFEFPDGWTNSYAEHEISFTNDNVVFAGASQQNSGATIDDCPVTKNQAISLVLTNSTKLLSAVRFDYKQWGTKAQTLTMKYSTDGGSTYNAFSPAVTSSEFALQVLDLPEGTNAIQVTGSNSSNQVGLTKISFDLEDKPIVTKTVTITTPSNGTLVVKNGDVPITSGDAIAVGTTLTIYATPNTDYSLSAISVKDEGNNDVTVNGDNEFDVPNSNVTVSATFVEDARPAASLTLWENGSEVAYPGDYKQNDHVTLPTTVLHDCANRVFVGWSAVEVAQTNDKPAYLEPGADFVLSAAGVNTLYAVYAAEGAATSNYKISKKAPANGETVIIARLVESTYYALTTASTPASSELTLNEGVVESPDDAILWDVETATDGVYLRPTGTTNGLHMNSSALKVANGDTNGDIKFTSNGDGTFKATRSDDARWIVVSGTNGLSCSETEANAAALYIFKAIRNYSKYSTTCDAAIDAPEFVLPEGTYTEAPQSVTITAADGATIYYTMTTDNSEPADPTDESAVYSSAISLSEAGTYKFKAFAVKGEAESEITEATYTINLPLTTMDQIFAKANAVGTTATDVTIVFNNWVISGVSTDGKQVYLTDGSKGLVIFDNGGSLGFSVGDILSGTVDCKVQKYNGFSEVTTLTSSSTGLTVSKGGTITPQSVSIEDLSGVNTGAPIIVNNVKYDGTNFTDGTNNIQPYTTLFADAVTSLTTNKYYNVTGIYTQFNSKKEILPRNADDIEELAQTAPTMTWYTSSAKTVTIAASATYFISAGDEFAPIFETNSSGTLTYSSNNDAVATINATTGALTLVGGTGDVLITCAVAADDVHNYAAGSQSFTLRVLQGATVDNVVILAQYNGTWYAMKNTGVTSSKAAAIEVAYSGGKVWNLSSSDQEAITWKRTVDGEGKVTFQAPNNNYLQMSGTNLAMGAAVCQWTWNETYYRVGSQARTFLYRPSASGFKSNAVSNAGANDYSALPVITTAVFADGEGYTEVRTGLEINRYYTICLPKKVTAVSGGSFWNLRYKDAEPGTLVYLEEASLPFDAGTPFIFQATATSLEVVYEGEATSTAGQNGALYGTFAKMNEGDLTGMYLLIQNAIRPASTDNYLVANRAYIDYNDLIVGTPQAAPGRRVRTMALQGQVATGVGELNADETPVKVLIDGQLYIIRGEKMYDATGRLVK